MQSRKLAPDRRTVCDKLPGGPVVFVSSPDRLSGKLCCQPLPLWIDKSRFSAGKFNLQIFLILFYLLFLDQEKSKIITSFGKDTIYGSYCHNILCDYSDRGITEKYYFLEFSSLTIVVNSDNFITSKHGGHGFLAV